MILIKGNVKLINCKLVIMGTILVVAPSNLCSIREYIHIVYTKVISIKVLG